MGRAGSPDNSILPEIRACPARPNCVSSKGSGNSFISPIQFTISPESAWRLMHRLVDQTGGKILIRQGFYLKAEYVSRLLRFKDDVEMVLVPGEDCIHIRSVSRLGYFDLGVNRKRVERLRTLFHQHQIIEQKK